MPKFRNLTNQVFTRLTVVSRAETPGLVRWICRCECGGTRTVLAKQLLNGGTRSCGCLYSDHGMSRTRIYRIWQGCRERCNNPKNQFYSNYGGRGIRVCSEWDHGGGFVAFAAWAQENGYSDSLSIDRKDNDGNYEPGNCRWVTMLAQANNTRSNRLLTFCGETKTMAEFARQVGLKRVTIDGRLRAGWTVEKALTTVPRDWGR